MDEIEFIVHRGPRLLVELGAALLAGGLVGSERELHGGAAGLKTCMLICLGATLYMQVSHLVLEEAAIGSADPTRIAGQIVSGIGFLGAGAILRDSGSVKGLTTAATVWFLGAIGIVIGCHFPITGLGLAAMTTLLLLFVRPIKDRLFGKGLDSK